MSVKQIFPMVSGWMRMQQDDVLDKFQSLKHSFTDGKGQKRFVYIPGTRKDRVLLVAHADTVFGDQACLDIGFYNGIFYSRNRVGQYTQEKGNFTTNRTGVGIGADDRAGCAIVWELRNTGHSILITSGEEIGCIASRRIMNSQWWVDEINKEHQFAVQFDRRGYKDIVFYNVGTNAFVKYVKGETGYTPEDGSYTDIRVLCKGICGVNMSVGYYNEHTSEEKLVYNQWFNTLATARAWLSKPDLPRFALDKMDLYDAWEEKRKKWGVQYGGNSEYFCRRHGHMAVGGTSYHFKKEESPKTSNAKVMGVMSRAPVITVSDGQCTFKLICPSCGYSQLEDAWWKNKMKCISCQKEM